MIFRFRAITTTLLLSACCIVYLQAQSPRTFYVGHSLSDQIPDMVQSLSNDHDEVNFSWVYQSIPGAPLRWQWDRKEANDYYPIDPHYYGFYDQDYGLASGNFDVLVLTESVPRYPAIIEESYAYADSFYQYAAFHNPGIQVYLYEDWHCLLSGTPTGCSFDIDSNPWRQRLEDDLSMWESIVDTLNARFNPQNPVCLIPAGQGLAKLYDEILLGTIPDINAIDDIFSDDIHLTDVGKYFVACIHFAMIHKTSPVGLTNQLQVWWGGDFEAPSPALALKFQEIAWEVVQEYPRTCVDSEPTKVVNEPIKIVISPNPTTDNIQVNGLHGWCTIEVIDIQGKPYHKLSGSTDNMEISMNDLSKGIYFLKITLDGTLYSVNKIVKL